MPKIDRSKIIPKTGSGYPPPFNIPCMAREKTALSDAGGLTQFGVHEMRLSPGAWASQRHWHSAEDELVYVLSGNPTLIDDDGETPLAPGDVCTHKGGVANAHHIVNNTDEDAVLLVVGTRSPKTDSGHYPDIDMAIPANGTPNRVFVKKDGSAF